MLTCHDARAVIARTIDDPGLPGDARAALRMHLATCASCLDEYETQHEVRRLLTLHIEEPLPAGFAERLSARLAQESSPRPSALPALPAVPAVRWRTWLPLLPVAATLALIVADAQLRTVTRTDTRPASTSATPSPATVTTEPPPSGAPIRHPQANPQINPPIAQVGPQTRRQATKVPSSPLQSPEQSQSPTSTAQQQHEAVADTKFPVTPVTVERVSPVAALPIVSAPDLTEALKLSDTQRKEIAAAIERVLTPDQRRLYRERQANTTPEGNPNDRRRASEGSGIRPRPTAPVPPPTPPPPF
jgi:hypothetical protein